MPGDLHWLRSPCTSANNYQYHCEMFQVYDTVAICGIWATLAILKALTASTAKQVRKHPKSYTQGARARGEAHEKAKVDPDRI